MPAYDILVVGHGIAGLWAARRAREAGFSVALADRDIGLGDGPASNTPLGALLPHLPDATSAKRRFQWAALDELSDIIPQLEAEFTAGMETMRLDIGYVRCGRLSPIRSENFLERSKRAVAHAGTWWNLETRQYNVEILPASEIRGWLSPECTPFGALYDEMSAQITAPAYRAALTAALSDQVKRYPHADIVAWDGRNGIARTRQGETIKAERLVVAAGVGSFPLLKRLTRHTYGHGIFGQCAMYKATLADGRDVTPPDQPILYDNGVYIVRQNDRLVVGSTSEKKFRYQRKPMTSRLKPVIARACEMVPALAQAAHIANWSGTRPRSAAKDPMVGCLDEDQKLYVLTGGYKTTLGIAHRLASALVDSLIGRPDSVALPETYSAAYHAHHAQVRAERKRLKS